MNIVEKDVIKMSRMQEKLRFRMNKKINNTKNTLHLGKKEHLRRGLIAGLIVSIFSFFFLYLGNLFNNSLFIDVSRPLWSFSYVLLLFLYDFLPLSRNLINSNFILLISFVTVALWVSLFALLFKFNYLWKTKKERRYLFLILFIVLITIIISLWGLIVMEGLSQF